MLPDIPLRLLHQPLGGGDPALVHAAAHLQADGEKPGAQVLHRGVLGQQGEPFLAGPQHFLFSQIVLLDDGQEDPQHPDEPGLGAPVVSAVGQKLVDQGGDLLPGAELDDRQELSGQAVLRLLGGALQPLHVLDIDGLSAPHHRLVLHRGPGLGAGAVELLQLLAGAADARRHRDAQDPGALGADLSQQAHQGFYRLLVPGRHHQDGGDAGVDLPVAAVPAGVADHLLHRHGEELLGQGGPALGAGGEAAHRNDLIAALPDGQAEAVGLLGHLPGVHGPPEQLLEELLPQEGQALLVDLVELVDVPPLGDLIVQQAPDPAQHIGELGGVHRLEDVLHHIELDGLLGVLKGVEAGEDNELEPGLAPGELRPQLQAVHEGHLDVGEDHVQVQRLGLLQGVHAVFGLGRDLKAQGFPVDDVGDGRPDLRLVIHDHDFIEVQTERLLPPLGCTDQY